MFITWEKEPTKYAWTARNVRWKWINASVGLNCPEHDLLSLLWKSARKHNGMNWPLRGQLRYIINVNKHFFLILLSSITWNNHTCCLYYIAADCNSIIEWIVKVLKWIVKGALWLFNLIDPVLSINYHRTFIAVVVVRSHNS